VKHEIFVLSIKIIQINRIFTLSKHLKMHFPSSSSNSSSNHVLDSSVTDSSVRKNSSKIATGKQLKTKLNSESENSSETSTTYKVTRSGRQRIMKTEQCTIKDYFDQKRSKSVLPPLKKGELLDVDQTLIIPEESPDFMIKLSGSMESYTELSCHEDLSITTLKYGKLVANNQLNNSNDILSDVDQNLIIREESSDLTIKSSVTMESYTELSCSEDLSTTTSTNVKLVAINQSDNSLNMLSEVEQNIMDSDIELSCHGDFTSTTSTNVLVANNQLDNSLNILFDVEQDIMDSDIELSCHGDSSTTSINVKLVATNQSDSLNIVFDVEQNIMDSDIELSCHGDCTSTTSTNVRLVANNQSDNSLNILFDVEQNIMDSDIELSCHGDSSTTSTNVKLVATNQSDNSLNIVFDVEQNIMDSDIELSCHGDLSSTTSTHVKLVAVNQSENYSNILFDVDQNIMGSNIELSCHGDLPTTASRHAELDVECVTDCQDPDFFYSNTSTVSRRDSPYNIVNTLTIPISSPMLYDIHNCLSTPDHSIIATPCDFDISNVSANVPASHNYSTVTDGMSGLNALTVVTDTADSKSSNVVSSCITLVSTSNMTSTCYLSSYVSSGRIDTCSLSTDVICHPSGALVVGQNDGITNDVISTPYNTGSAGSRSAVGVWGTEVIALETPGVVRSTVQVGSSVSDDIYLSGELVDYEIDNADDYDLLMHVRVSERVDSKSHQSVSTSTSVCHTSQSVTHFRDCTTSLLASSESALDVNTSSINCMYSSLSTSQVNINTDDVATVDAAATPNIGVNTVLTCSSKVLHDSLVVSTPNCHKDSSVTLHDVCMVSTNNLPTISDSKLTVSTGSTDMDSDEADYFCTSHKRAKKAGGQRNLVSLVTRVENPSPSVNQKKYKATSRRNMYLVLSDEETGEASSAPSFQTPVPSVHHSSSSSVPTAANTSSALSSNTEFVWNTQLENELVAIEQKQTPTAEFLTTETKLRLARKVHIYHDSFWSKVITKAGPLPVITNFYLSAFLRSLTHPPPVVPYTTEIVRSFTLKVGRPRVAKDCDLIEFFYPLHHQLFCQALLPVPKKSEWKGLKLTGVIEDVLLRNALQQANVLYAESLSILAGSFADVLSRPSSLVRFPVISILLEYWVALDSIVRWKDMGRSGIANALFELPSIATILQNHPVSVAANSAPALIASHLELTCALIFDSLLSYHIQFIRTADTLQLLYLTSAVSLKLILYLYKSLWLAPPTQPELRLFVAHSLISNTSDASNRYATALCSHKQAFMQNAVPRKLVLMLLNRIYDTLHLSLEPSEPPGDHDSIDIRHCIYSDLLNLLEPVWSHLHDLAISEATLGHHVVRNQVDSFAECAAQFLTGALENYKGHCLDKVGRLPDPNSSTSASFSSYVYESVFNFLEAFMGTDYFFSFKLKEYQKFIKEPLLVLLVPATVSKQLRQTAELFIQDIMQMQLLSPLSDGHKLAIMTKQLTGYCNRLTILDPKAQLDIHGPHLNEYLIQTVQSIRRNHSHYGVNSTIARIALHDEYSRASSIEYSKVVHQMRIPQRLSTAGLQTVSYLPSLTLKSMSLVLTTNLLLLDGFPSSTSLTDIISEVRHLCSLLGVCVDSDKIASMKHNIPRTSGLLAVIVPLVSKYTFVQPYDPLDQRLDERPYFSSLLGLRLTKKETPFSYQMQPISSSAAHDLVHHLLVPICTIRGFVEEYKTASGAISSPVTHFSDQLGSQANRLVFLREVVPYFLSVGGNSKFHGFETILDVQLLSSADSKSQARKCRTLFGLDKNCILNLPGWKLFEQASVAGGTFVETPKLILDFNRTVQVTHIPIPDRYSFGHIFKLFQSEPCASDVSAVYGTSSADLPKSGPHTHLTVHSFGDKKITLSPHLEAIVGNGWYRTAPVGLIGRDKLELKNTKIVESKHRTSKRERTKVGPYGKHDAQTIDPIAAIPAAVISHKRSQADSPPTAKKFTKDTPDLPVSTTEHGDDISLLTTSISSIASTLTTVSNPLEIQTFLQNLSTLVDNQTKIINELSELREHDLQLIQSLSSKLSETELMAATTQSVCDMLHSDLTALRDRVHSLEEAASVSQATSGPMFTLVPPTTALRPLGRAGRMSDSGRGGRGSIRQP